MTTHTLTDYDRHLWCESKLYRCYEKMGAHPCTREGVEGAHFAVWAPNAERVSVVGDFNGWNEDAHPLTLDEGCGIWSGFVPGATRGECYKYSVHSRYNGYRSERADPFAFFAEERPRTASKVWTLENHEWGDEEWMAQRREWNPYQAPINVYEVHLGSWMRVPEEENRYMTYRELAPTLTAYVKKMGYTHVELLPITEHPFDGSWGYQTIGYFAPTSRFGTPEDFKFLVDSLHQENIGVILDWVPAHFPKDGHALAYFDGTHLYEHEDPRQGEHPEWGTLIFNYGRNEVRNFLISSALFWLDVYHIDGLRVDAVASMLYLDYARSHGQWIPNQYGGRENLEAVEFLRELNRALREYYPGVLTFAEESTSWPKVTASPEEGGLGFTFKWNMGWMNDTLKYIEKDPFFRKYQHNNLTFGMIYQYSENFLLPLSHDEVVHGKSSLIHKMPGDDWQKFANLRLLLGYKIGYPGKKLLFMGGEFAQRAEWNFASSLDWHLLEFEPHQGMQDWVRELNQLYLKEPALHQLDSDPVGFEWVECNDADSSVVSFMRKAQGGEEALLFICNFTPVPRLEHRVGLPWKGTWELVLDSDSEQFGGSGLGEKRSVEAEEIAANWRDWSGLFEVPPLGVVIYRGVAPKDEEED